MKYYAAVTQKEEVQAATVRPPNNILTSYHYWKKKKDLIKEYVVSGFDIFVDSGAFSAMSKGVEININEYCEFLLDTGVTRYASLDVIGNAKETLKNHKYMIEEYGLNPIPTFHMGSNIRELEPLMEYNYIALGGLVFSSGIINHCDEVWHYILSNNPTVKVHGFGLTNTELMKRYPWYSVDSSSYNSCKRFGRQNILWNGFKFKTFSEAEYLLFLNKQGHEIEDIDNKKKWFLYDSNSCQSYKDFTANLKEINKYKSFDYLTQQTKLF